MARIAATNDRSIRLDSASSEEESQLDRSISARPRYEAATVELAGWGRFPRSRSRVLRPESVSEAVPPRAGAMITRGQGRSYGNAATCSGGLVMLTERLNSIGTIDEETGLVTAEAGSTVADLLDACVPRGWFPCVTPGTKFVSLGGCVAADVHGKNHHRDGTFGGFVGELDLVLADGSTRVCSPARDQELFWATIGGMGLTGIITHATVRLARVPSAYMVVRHHRARDLDELFKLIEDPACDDQYSVAWVDCLRQGQSLGRGILIRAHHAAIEELPERVKNPLHIKPRGEHNLSRDLPGWALSRAPASVFNNLYYWWQGAKTGSFVADYASYFYPLDRLGHWNRLYGKRGFVQYQCVLTEPNGHQGLEAILEKVGGSGHSSFLGTVKRFGPEGAGMLSFPLAGYSLALDIPIGDPELFAFLDRLDEIVLHYGGRVYLAKDARMRAGTFQAMYPRFGEWKRIKSKFDPDHRFSSDLGRRLGMSA
jgi:decaprenylphospho-beta-D-ribofuranose 2-oxidase